MIEYRLSSRYVSSKEYVTYNRVRIQRTVDLSHGLVKSPSLDADQPNYLGQLLKVDEFAYWDLNWPWPHNKKYKTIVSFEVLEHLQNPLLYLTEIRRHLENNGKLILTTPVAFHHLLPVPLYRQHFKEYRRDELITLMEMADLTVKRMERFSGYTYLPLKYIGIRPIIRLVRDRTLGQHWFVIAEKRRKPCTS